MSRSYRFEIGEIIFCEWLGGVYKAKVMERRNSANTEYYVHYSGWDRKWDEWVTEESCAKNSPLNEQLAKMTEEFHEDDQDSNSHDEANAKPRLRERKEWAKKEIQYLMKYKNKFTMKELAMHLERTEGAVTQKLRKLELDLEEKRKRPTSPVCQREFETMRSLGVHATKKQDEQHAKLREIKNTTAQDSSVHEVTCTSNSNEKKTNTTVNTGNSTINIHMTVPSQAPASSKKSKFRKRGRDKNEQEHRARRDDRPRNKRKVHKLKWSKYEVAEWLESLDEKFKEYAHQFIDEDVTGELMDTLDDDSLEDIIRKKLHRKRILLKWKKL